MNNWKDLFEKRTFSTPGLSGLLRYRLYVPPEGGQGKPVVLFLHGAGERGDDNEKQLDVGFCRHYFELGYEERVPAVLVVPQCPDGKRWVETDWDKGSYDADLVGESESLKLVDRLLDALKEELNYDDKRVYVTGISMGGYGTWNIITHHPDRFAAALPICGGADPGKVSRLIDLPIRTYHADDDWVVPPTSTRETVAALEKAGGRVTYIEYHNGLGHGCWDTAYQEPDSLSWLFKQNKE